LIRFWFHSRSPPLSHTLSSLLSVSRSPLFFPSNQCRISCGSLTEPILDKVEGGSPFFALRSLQPPPSGRKGAGLRFQAFFSFPRSFSPPPLRDRAAVSLFSTRTYEISSMLGPNPHDEPTPSPRISSSFSFFLPLCRQGNVSFPLEKMTHDFCNLRMFLLYYSIPKPLSIRDFPSLFSRAQIRLFSFLTHLFNLGCLWQSDRLPPPPNPDQGLLEYKRCRHALFSLSFGPALLHLSSSFPSHSIALLLSGFVELVDDCTQPLL